MAEQQHELAAVEGRERFKAVVGGPDSAACDSMCMGMEIDAVAGETSETSMRVSAFQILVEHSGDGARHLADDGTPVALLLLAVRL